MAVQLLRRLEADDVKCPAATLVGDAAIRCAIEEHTLVGQEEPTAVEGLCCGEYTACSTWRASKEVEARGGDLRKILDQMTDEGRKLRAGQQLRVARVRQAQLLMAEDSPEGRAFRRRIVDVLGTAERG